MKILIIIIFILLVGAFFIISNDNIRLDSWEHISHFSSLYISWLSRVFLDLGNFTGSVIKFFGI